MAESGIFHAKGGKILEISLKAIYYRCVGVVELCGG
nr:MAG TPA: hypothetical protein [Caudoviricetes sp.]